MYRVFTENLEAKLGVAHGSAEEAELSSLAVPRQSKRIRENFDTEKKLMVLCT
jgi:hypothetical protein